MGGQARWGDAADVRREFGLSDRRIRELVESGAVRKAKLGDTGQARCIYRLGDIEDTLQRIAAGLEPVRRRGASRREGVGVGK